MYSLEKDEPLETPGRRETEHIVGIRERGYPPPAPFLQVTSFPFKILV